MRRRLIVRPEAQADIVAAYTWYGRQRPGLDGEFLAEVEVVLGLIETNPLLYPVIYRDIRRALTRRFPFAVFYLIDRDQISVLAVLHCARNPRLWQKRGRDL